MKSPITIFNEWVIENKDDGMQKIHTPAVMDILQYSLFPLRTAFSFIDAGCDTAIGVDGEIEMINKAKRLDIEGQYILSDLLDYKPKKSGFST